MASTSAHTQEEDPLTNLVKPITSATLTIRIIKSFEYRTEKSLVLHDLNLEQLTAGQLKALAKEGPDQRRVLFAPALIVHPLVLSANSRVSSLSLRGS